MKNILNNGKMNEKVLSSDILNVIMQLWNLYFSREKKPCE
jgi:hypothetical protein